MRDAGCWGGGHWAVCVLRAGVLAPQRGDVGQVWLCRGGAGRSRGENLCVPPALGTRGLQAALVFHRPAASPPSLPRDAASTQPLSHALGSVSPASGSPGLPKLS